MQTGIEAIINLEIMESVLNLKQCTETSDLVCIICLKPPQKNKKLSNGGEKAIESLRAAGSLRDKKYNPQFKGAIQRVQGLNVAAVTYHSSCYSTFTSKEMIKRLTDIEANLQNAGDRSQAVEIETKWDLCILCQEPQDRTSEHLRQISSDNKQQQLRDLAEWDINLKVRINNIDLIVNGVKYHTNCYNKRYREMAKGINQSTNPSSSNRALKELSAELHIGAGNGEVCSVL